MTDYVLDRITFDPKASIAAGAAHHPSQLKPIPWPADLTPIPEHLPFGPDDPIDAPLFKVDSVIVTWTAAEWQALTDVLSPDHGQDAPGVLAAYERAYAYNFASYLPDLTDRSPGRDARCLARYRMSMGCGKNVLLVHSMLHLAVDGPNLPLRRLIDQIIDETQCSRLITTGTAGGIDGAPDQGKAQLGDVVIGAACHFNCKKQFATAPFVNASYPTSIMTSPVDIKQYVEEGEPNDGGPGSLVAANFPQLIAARADNDTSWSLALGNIETTDFFAFSTTSDTFGLRAYDSEAMAVEMDDATFGLVEQDRKAAGKPTPWWTAVRCVSDPEMDMSKYATEEDAATAAGLIYRRSGYWDVIPSAIISWLLAVA